MKGLAAILLLASPFLGFRPAEAAVHVYVSYLEQEVESVMRAVMKNRGGMAVLAVGARDLSPESVFGLDPRRLGGGEARLAGAGGGIEDQLARALAKAGGEYRARKPMGGLELDGAVLNSGASAQLGVANLTPGTDASEDVIVVIQAPELGRQPNLLSAYLEILLPTLQSLPQARPEKGGIHLSSFGTAGGIDKSVKPGTVEEVDSSLFVGVEVVPGASPKRYRSLISFAGVGDREEYPPVFSKDFGSREAAEAAAKEAFASLTEAFAGVRGCGEAAAAAPKAPDWMHPATARIFRDLLARDRPMSLTLSFFGDAAVKAAARKLGLSNVNMEDYHVIRAANASRGPGRRAFDTVSLGRAVADPSEITPEASRGIDRWFRDGRYTARHFEDAIVWGVRGRAWEELPESARWDATRDLSPEQASRIAAPVRFPSGMGQLDPFFHEMSESVLETLSDTSLLQQLADRNLPQDLPADARQELQRLVSAKAESTRKLAESLRAAATDSATASDLRAGARKLVNEVSALDVPPGGALSRALDGRARVPLLATGQRVPGSREEAYWIPARNAYRLGNSAATVDQYPLDRQNGYEMERFF